MTQGWSRRRGSSTAPGVRYDAPMSALTPREAENLLQDAELAPVTQGGLVEVRELWRVCLEAGIPAVLGSDPCCEKGGCGPKVQLVVRSADVPSVSTLLKDRWTALLATVDAPAATRAPVEPVAGELPCPACGTAAPLKDGACSDCGLQLE